MIAIPMPMPDNCDVCRFSVGQTSKCTLVDGCGGWINGRHPDCPLMKVRSIVSERIDQPEWTGMAGRERLLAKEDLFRFLRDHNLIAEERKWINGQRHFRLSISVVLPDGYTQKEAKA